MLRISLGGKNNRHVIPMGIAPNNQTRKESKEEGVLLQAGAKILGGAVQMEKDPKMLMTT